MKKNLCYIMMLILMFGFSGNILIRAEVVNSSFAPAISNISPDYYSMSSATTMIITGENLGTSDVEVWTYSDNTEVDDYINSLGTDKMPKLPDTPPAEASQVNIIDKENQVILCQNDGDVIWIKNSVGFSKPYLINRTKPFWISEESVEQGGNLSIFGFGLSVNPMIVLKSNEKTYDVSEKVFLNAGNGRDTNENLINFELPDEIVPASYDVYINNQQSKYNWVKAGTVTVETAKNQDYKNFFSDKLTDAQKKSYKIFDVRDFGAKGNGKTNDFAAINKAIDKAKNANGILFFQPGTYLVDETLVIPENVRVLGSGNENCVIEGIGYNPVISNIAWYSKNTNNSNVPFSIVYLSNHTSFEAVTLKGAVGKGIGGVGILQLAPSSFTLSTGGGTVSDILIKDCKIIAAEENYLNKDLLYYSAIYSFCKAKNVKILNNDIKGSIFLGGYSTASERVDIIGNIIRGGQYSGVIALQMYSVNCIIDGNQLLDSPGRFMPNPIMHNYIRYNEIHDFAHGSSMNSEEVYLIHGESGQKYVSDGWPTSAQASILTDTTKNWKPGQYKNAVVIVTSGKGMGQYRFVEDNTATELKLKEPFRVIPNSNSEYMVAFLYTENLFSGNINDSVGRFSIYFDAISNIITNYRDDRGGMDLWGADRSSVDASTNTLKKNGLSISWYNVFKNCWLDGSNLEFISSAPNNSAYKTIPVFANIIAGNYINNPGLDRSGFQKEGAKSVSVSLGEIGDSGDINDRSNMSHTIISNNYILNSNTGIQIPKLSRKTYAYKNKFENITVPIRDLGSRTILEGNINLIYTETGKKEQKIENKISLVENMPEKVVTKYKLSDKSSLYAYERYKVMTIVSSMNHQDVSKKDRTDECVENLKQLYKLIQKFETKYAQLPYAAFYPENPLSDKDNIINMLGDEAKKWGMCPTIGKELDGITNIEYIWNAQLNGNKISNIKDPSNTWLLMDIASQHDWMIQNKYAGHQGGYNVLYADGTVKNIQIKDTPVSKIIIAPVFNQKIQLPEPVFPISQSNVDYLMIIMIAGVVFFVLAAAVVVFFLLKKRITKKSLV
jgi:prepilin-type processing-associated H-X9-DG protein